MYLFSGDAGGQITGYSHGFKFGAAQDNVSFGRFVDRVGDEDLVLQISSTLGIRIPAARVGPIVITEINYHPIVSSNEFIKLKNATANPVPLFDPAAPTNAWKVNGLAFSLPPT